MKLFTNLKNHFKKTAKDMKGMTFREKVDHIWTYYKEYAFTVIMTVIIVGAMVVSFFTPVPVLVSSGSMVNVSLTLEGHDYLTDVFYEEVLGSPEGKVALTTANYSNEDTVDAVDSSYQSFMGVSAKVEARELDYLLLDQVGMNFYGSEEMLMDLRRLLPEEEIAQLHQDGKLSFAMYGQTYTLSELGELLAEGKISFYSLAQDQPVSVETLAQAMPLDQISQEAGFTAEQLETLQPYITLQTQMAEGKVKLVQTQEIYNDRGKLLTEFTLDEVGAYIGQGLIVAEGELAGVEGFRTETFSTLFAEGKLQIAEVFTLQSNIYIPVAINLDGLAYAREAIQNDMPVYIAFIDNTPNFETCQKLWEHIKNWE